MAILRETSMRFKVWTTETRFGGLPVATSVYEGDDIAAAHKEYLASRQKDFERGGLKRMTHMAEFRGKEPETGPETGVVPPAPIDIPPP
jgi:hypothetical protein